MTHRQDSATYETQVAQWLFKEICNSFPSLSPNYLRLDTATRHFTRNSYQEEFTETSKVLSKNNWDSLQAGSNFFDELEMDWLAHIYDSPGGIPGRFEPMDANMKIVPMPPKKWLKKQKVPGNVKMFDKKISEASLFPEGGPEPNAYILFEITMDHKILRMKLAQLERDLTFLLCRKKSSGVNSILEIVRLVGVAAPKITPNEFIDQLKLYTTQLPLLTELWLNQRLVCAVISVDNAYTAKLLSEFNALSSSIGSIDSEIKQNELIIVKKKVEMIEMDVKMKEMDVKKKAEMIEMDVKMKAEMIEMEKQRMAKMMEISDLKEKIAYWKSRNNQEKVDLLEAKLEKYYEP
jgi:hypothetical protein